MEKTTKELAQEWFSVDIYEQLACFDSTKWAEQIAKRAVLKAAIDTNENQAVELMLEDLIDAPCREYSYKYSITRMPVSELSYSSGSVVPLAFDDLLRLGELEEMFPDQAQGDIDGWACATLGLEALARFAHIKVDLNARDTDIVQDFEKWLNAYRLINKRTSAKRPYRNWAKERQAWFDTKIIPYFDLTTWAAWRGIPLSEQSIVELLYEHEPDLTRDSLRALARNIPSVITMSTAMALSMLKPK